MAEPAPPLELRLERGTSLLAELRRRGERADDFPARLPAARVDPARDLPLEVVLEHRVAGRPLLWLRPGAGAFVDEAAAGELACVDATRLAAGEEQAVGRVLPAAISALGERGLLRFLLQAGVVRTWAHLEATVALREERRRDGAWEADLEGVHVYWTQRRHEGRLAFTVRVAADGAVTVRGR